MVVHREVIQTIRLKKQLAAVQAQLEASAALRQQMLGLSGLLEKGIDPSLIQATQQNIQDMLIEAERLEVELNLREAGVFKRAGRIPV
jgi:hypothetical protein